MNNVAGTGLWDETDGFYYDELQKPDGTRTPLRTRSLVGLLPLIAVTVARFTAQVLLPSPEFALVTARVFSGR